LKVKQENAQANAGAQILPPAPDDEHEIHLQDHIADMQEKRAQLDSLMAQLQTNPSLQVQLQPIMEKLQNAMNALEGHSKLHIEMKKENDILKNGPKATSMNMNVQTSQPEPKLTKPPFSGNMSGGVIGQANGGLR